MCLLKYSSTPSMKIATGELTARSRGDRREPELRPGQRRVGEEGDRLLAEALRADHDELLIAIEIQKGVDLRRVVQERVVEIFGDANVVGVHGPGAHANPEA
jgi:hypothetical protein